MSEVITAGKGRKKSKLTPAKPRRRVSLYVTSRMTKFLDELSAETGCSESAIIRESILLLDWMRKRRKAGAAILVEDSDGTTREQTFAFQTLQ